MSNSYLNLLTQIVRHPRHLATGEPQLQCEVLRLDGLPWSDEPPALLDFSRGGCCLRWQIRLEKGELIAVRLRDELSGLCLELPATVRWVRVEEEGGFTAGCQFEREVDYELLGELFLAGFLSTEEAPLQ
jgi:hypothetical protein